MLRAATHERFIGGRKKAETKAKGSERGTRAPKLTQYSKGQTDLSPAENSLNSGLFRVWRVLRAGVLGEIARSIIELEVFFPKFGADKLDGHATVGSIASLVRRGVRHQVLLS